MMVKYLAMKGAVLHHYDNYIKPCFDQIMLNVGSVHDPEVRELLGLFVLDMWIKWLKEMKVKDSTIQGASNLCLEGDRGYTALKR